MKNKRFSQPVLAALIAVFTLAASTAELAADDVQHHDLDGITKVDFYIAKSNVTLIGSDRGDLELQLEEPLTGFDPDKITQTVSREGDTLVITFEHPKSQRSWWSWGTDNNGYKAAILRVPADLAAKIKTSGGNVHAEAMNSAIQLHTSGGNVHASNISGPLHIKTSGGNIRLKQINGDTDARTSGGNISAAGLIGAVDLHTSGGNINIDGELSTLKAHTSGGHINADLHSQLLEPLELSTSGGNVSATLAQGINAPVQLSTSGGSVSISLPRDQAFELYAKSNGGGVSLNHTGSFQGTLDKKKIEGSINGGGPLVKLTTSGGRVNIKEL